MTTTYVMNETSFALITLTGATIIAICVVAYVKLNNKKEK